MYGSYIEGVYVPTRSGTSRFVTEFREERALGRGGFGKVVLASNCLDGVQYAVKKVPLSDSLQWRRRLRKVLREVKVLAMLNHDNIVRYHQAWLERMPERADSAMGDEDEEDDEEDDEDETNSVSVRDASHSTEGGVDSLPSSHRDATAGLPTGADKGAAAPTGACMIEDSSPAEGEGKEGPSPGLDESALRALGLVRDDSCAPYVHGSASSVDSGASSGGGGGGTYGSDSPSSVGRNSPASDQWPRPAAGGRGTGAKSVLSRAASGAAVHGGSTPSGAGTVDHYARLSSDAQVLSELHATQFSSPAAAEGGNAVASPVEVCGLDTAAADGIAHTLPEGGLSSYGHGRGYVSSGISDIGEGEEDEDEDEDDEGKEGEEGEEDEENKKHEEEEEEEEEEEVGAHISGPSPRGEVPVHGGTQARGPPREGSEQEWGVSTFDPQDAELRNPIQNRSYFSWDRSRSGRPEERTASRAQRGEHSARGRSANSPSGTDPARAAGPAAAPAPVDSSRPGRRGTGGPRRRRGSDWTARPRYNLRLFIQMQYCPRTLAGDLAHADRSIEVPRVLAMMSQLACGLRHVHRCGLIHRDVKPANIFFAKDARGTPVAKLGDFGLSRHVATAQPGTAAAASSLLDRTPSDEALAALGAAPPGTATRGAEAERRTVSPSVTRRLQRRLRRLYGDNTAGVGTFLYASPEQLAGRAYDAKADVYGLGMVLFESMHKPFATLMERHLVLTAARRREVPPSWPHVEEPADAVRDLLMRLLSDRPEARPSADDVVYLCESLAGKPALVGPELSGNAWVLMVRGQENAELIDAVRRTIRSVIARATVPQYGVRSAEAGSVKLELVVEGVADREAIDRVLVAVGTLSGVHEVTAAGCT